MKLNLLTKIRWIKETTRTWQLLTDKELSYYSRRDQSMRCSYEWYVLDNDFKKFLKDSEWVLSPELKELNPIYEEDILRENKKRIDIVQRCYGRRRTKFWKAYWSWEIKTEKEDF